MTIPWYAFGTTVSVTTLDPRAERSAARLIQQGLRRAERTVDLSHHSGQPQRLLRRGGHLPRPGGLLAHLVSAALEGARYTDGRFDPTVGNAVLRSCRSRALGAVAGAVPVCGGATSAAVPAAGYRDVSLGRDGLVVPQGVLLDLTSTAKAVLGNAAAAFVAKQLNTGVLLQVGGDVSAHGPAPAGGWRVAVGTADASDGAEFVELGSGRSMATSRGTGVVDPRTGQPVARHWAAVTVLDDALLGKALAVGAHVLGTAAVDWLEDYGVPVRLEHRDGHVVRLGNWPGLRREPTRLSA